MSDPRSINDIIIELGGNDNQPQEHVPEIVLSDRRHAELEAEHRLIEDEVARINHIVCTTNTILQNRGTERCVLVYCYDSPTAQPRAPGANNFDNSFFLLGRFNNQAEREVAIQTNPSLARREQWTIRDGELDILGEDRALLPGNGLYERVRRARISDEQREDIVERLFERSGVCYPTARDTGGRLRYINPADEVSEEEFRQSLFELTQSGVIDFNTVREQIALTFIRLGVELTQAEITALDSRPADTIEEETGREIEQSEIEQIYELADVIIAAFSPAQSTRLEDDIVSPDILIHTRDYRIPEEYQFRDADRAVAALGLIKGYRIGDFVFGVDGQIYIEGQKQYTATSNNLKNKRKSIDIARVEPIETSDRGDLVGHIRDATLNRLIHSLVYERLSVCEDSIDEIADLFRSSSRYKELRKSLKKHSF